MNKWEQYIELSKTALDQIGLWENLSKDEFNRSISEIMLQAARDVDRGCDLLLEAIEEESVPETCSSEEVMRHVKCGRELANLSREIAEDPEPWLRQK